MALDPGTIDRARAEVAHLEKLAPLNTVVRTLVCRLADPGPAVAVVDDEIRILEYLNEQPHRRKHLPDIAEGAVVDLRTARKLVNRLMAKGLVDRGDGPRSGAAITERGKALVRGGS